MIRTRKDKSYDEQTYQNDTNKELKTEKNPLHPFKKIKKENTTTESSNNEQLTNLSLLQSRDQVTEQTATVGECQDSDKTYEKGNDDNVTKLGESEMLEDDKSNHKEKECKVSGEEIGESDLMESERHNKVHKIKIEGYESNEMEGEGEEEEESYTSMDIGAEYHDPTCTECRRAWKVPKKSELVMYLHAHAYKV